MTSDSSVPERCLDAALEVAAMHGLTRLSVGDVAKRAGLSRPTLYKHFPSRDVLMSQMVLREASRIVEQVIAAAERHEDPFDSVYDAIHTALHLLRGHPLLDRLLATEPEALLPLLIDGRTSVLDVVQDVAREVIDRRSLSIGEIQAQAGADLLSRMLVSYAVRPPDLEPEVIAQFLSTAVVAGVLTAPADAAPSLPTS
jgi:AcrR family transcriptional regulator